MSRLFIISSVAGGGKSTLIQSILNKYPNFHFSISYTTRPKRKLEKNGVNYFFLSKKEFELKIELKEFLEWACVHNHYYGTDREQIEISLQNKKPTILDIDIQGAKSIKKKMKDCISIFIEPPCEEIWIKRLIERNTETKEQIQIRIENGKKEILEKKNFDYTVLNENLNVALKDLEFILLKELNS